MANGTRVIERTPAKASEPPTPVRTPTPPTSPSAFDLPDIQRAAGNLAFQHAASAGGEEPDPHSPPRAPDPVRALLPRALLAPVSLIGNPYPWAIPALAWAIPRLVRPRVSLDDLAERAAARADIELRGTPHFIPDPLVALYIRKGGPAGARLRVHFGDLASGSMIIRADDRGYQAGEHWLPMKHPRLVPRDPETELGLVVWLTDGVFHGKLATAQPGPSRPLPIQYSETGLLPLVFGRSYRSPDDLEVTSWTNQLTNGELKFALGFWLRPPDGSMLVGAFALVDGDVAFRAAGQLEVEGAERELYEVERTPAGILSARPKLSFAESWKAHGFQGQIEASYFDGSFQARGRVAIAYPKTQPRVRGEVNVVATTPERAWAAARAHDPSPHVTGGIEPENTAGGALAFTAWGQLDLELAPGSPAVGKKAATSPLTARALFLVDPEGHLTARGVLRMPGTYELLPQYSEDYPPLIDWSKKLAGTNFYPGISGELRVQVLVTPFAIIGPFTLRDLVADGTFSTRPDAGSEIKLGGAFNASAAAGMKAKAGVEAALEIGIDTPWPLPDIDVDVATVDISLEGTGTIKGYIDARPEITRTSRKGADPAAEAPEYRIRGDLHVAGEIVVALKLGAGLDLFGKWNPSASIGKEFPLANAGMAVRIDHIFGGKELPKVRFDPIKFDPEKFATDLVAGTAPPPSGRKVHGSFRQPGQKPARVTAEEPPTPPPPPDRPFELRVPFRIGKYPHELFLRIAPAASVVEFASPLRRRVVKVLQDALDYAESFHASATSADMLELYENQIDELKGLLDQVDEIQDAADALAPEPEHFWAADAPGLDDLAAAMAEYGIRFGDENITGAARLLTGAIEETHVEETTPRRYTYLGAERIGTTDSFTGSFDDRAWTWTGFPAYSILRHPVNSWTAGNFRYPDATVVRPSGTYRYGGRTKGWDATAWRRHVLDLLEAKEDTGMTRHQARKAVLEDFEKAGFVDLTWSDIWLDGGEGFGWQGHHVHEVSWGGPHHASNIQYLKQPNHHPASTWWNNRRDDIKDHLQILR